jgi:protein-S-isoprenylcysteine O-methyltransferase Ste14
VLPLEFLQISAAVALVATSAGFIVGVVRRRRELRAPVVRSFRLPVRGTQAVWVVGTLVAVFWPVGFFLLPEYTYHWPAGPDFPISSGLQLLGVVLGITGGLLFSRSARALGAQMTPEIRVQEGHRLIRTGPYRYVRHPVYTGILLTALGQTLLFLSPLAGSLTILLAVLAVYRARLEEELLGSPEAFGAEYAAYATRTGRFLPKWPTRP